MLRVPRLLGVSSSSSTSSIPVAAELITGTVGTFHRTLVKLRDRYCGHARSPR